MTTDAPRTTTGGLGRGLAALIPPARALDAPQRVPLTALRRNPYQPRRTFPQAELETLAASIREHGVLQPILVTRATDGTYELIAGERRVRAAELAGLSDVPAIVRDADRHQQLAIALVENLQRSDLDPLDEARAFRRLADEFGLTQEEIATRVGRARPSIANTLRLLEMAEPVQQAVAEGSISEGHARAIGALSDHRAQTELAAVVQERGLSVRQTEDLARRLREGDPATRSRTSHRPAADPEVERLEVGMREALGTKVTVRPSKRGGRITIEYYDANDLGRLYERLTGGAA